MSGAVILVMLLGLPLSAMAHGKGIYATEAEAQAKAKQLSCSGVHRNGDAWMPCRDEAELHRALRKQ